MLAMRFICTQRMSRAGHIQQIGDQGVQVIGLLGDDEDELADHGGASFGPPSMMAAAGPLMRSE